ncbi:MAG: metallophosphoesterase [Ignavibacteriales bacterium]
MTKGKIILYFLILILILTGGLLYSRYVATTGLVVKEYKITNKKITSTYTGLKIVHISDIHYGSTIFKDELDEIVKKVNILKPDIVLFTGDLFTDDLINDKYIKELTNELSKIEAKIGKYAINGNHDYDHEEEFEQIIEKSGFINLNDTYDVIYNKNNEAMFIAGISTNSYGKLGINDKIEPIMNYLQSEENKATYNILLLHEPDFVDDIKYSNFDLVLAGHSHNGQVRLPFIGAIYTPYGSKQYYNEHYKLKDTDLYISSGLGTSLLKLRLFNKPSFNFYRMSNK